MKILTLHFSWVPFIFDRIFKNEEIFPISIPGVHLVWFQYGLEDGFDFVF